MRKIQSGPPLGIVERRKNRIIAYKTQADTLKTLADKGLTIPPIPAPTILADEPEPVDQVTVTVEKPKAPKQTKQKVTTRKKTTSKKK